MPISGKSVFKEQELRIKNYHSDKATPGRQELGKRKSNDQIELDYRSLFGPSEKYKGVSLSEFSRFETEIMYHYTMNRELRQNIEALVQNQLKEKKEE
jgi:hypothetical protein